MLFTQCSQCCLHCWMFKHVVVLAMLIWLKLHPNQIEKPTQDESWTFLNISEKLGQYHASHWLGASLESALCIIRLCDARWCHRTSGLVLGCWDFKSHFHEILKCFHNWPEKLHKMGLDTSSVSSPLYPFPSPFLLGDLVNAYTGTWWLILVMACGLFSTRPLLEPMMTYCQLDM